MFFVEESRAANQLRQLGSIDTNKGSVNVYVKPSPPPRGLDGDDRPAWNSRGGQTSRYSRGGGNRGGSTRGFFEKAEHDVTMEEDPSAVLLVGVNDGW